MTLNLNLPSRLHQETVAASQTDEPLVAAFTLKRIRVIAAHLEGAAAAATGITFNSKPSGAGSAITPTFNLAAAGSRTLPYSDAGWFDTLPGEGLSVTTVAGGSVGVIVVYVVI